MDLHRALTHLRMAGYTVTPLSPDHWRVQFGQGKDALDVVLTAQDLIAFVTQYQRPNQVPAEAAPDLPQMIALLRACGLTLEPCGIGQWRIADRPDSAGVILDADALILIGQRIATLMPWVLQHQGPPTPVRLPITPATANDVCLMLARLGRVTAPDLARLCSYHLTDLHTTLRSLQHSGKVRTGSEQTWELTPKGRRSVEHMIPITSTSAPELPHPHLVMTTLQLLMDLRALQLSRVEIVYPAMSMPTALLTVSPEPRGFAWTRNLATQAAAQLVPYVTCAVVLIEPEHITAKTFQEYITMLQQPIQGITVQLPCFITTDAAAVPELHAYLIRQHPGPWLLSSVADARQGRWISYPIEHLGLNLALSVQSVWN